MDAEDGARFEAAVDAEVDRHAADDRSLAQRRNDALVRLVCGEASNSDVTVVALVDAETLADPDGPARESSVHDLAGMALSPRTAQRLACDRPVVRLVARLMGHGRPEVLDVGRAARFATTAQRQAMVARNDTCDVGGCVVPHHRCEVHHLHHWAHDGPTDLDQLVFACAHHHRLVHECGWTMTRAPDGDLDLHPPWWIPPDPD